MDPSGARIAVEIVDVAVNPLRVVKDRVIVTPTLMVCDAAAAPPLIGDLSDAAIVRAFLEAALAKK